MPRRASRRSRTRCTDSIIAAKRDGQPQDPRVRVLAAVDRPRERDRPADARRVPDAARQHARLVRRRSGGSADDLPDRPARARAARRRGRRDRGRGQGPRRHDHAHAGARRPRDVLRHAGRLLRSRREGRDGKAIAQIALAANLASPARVRHRAVERSSRSAARSSQPPEAFAITHSQKLWIYLVLLAAGLIVVEWVTYHRRITV